MPHYSSISVQKNCHAWINPPIFTSSHNQIQERIEVNKIISYKGPPGQQKYLTAWKGYLLSENTWESESNLRHAKQLLTEYKATHHVNFLHTCLSFPNLMCLSNSSYLKTFPVLLDSQFISLNSYNLTTSLLNALEPTLAFAPVPVAPSTTEPRKQHLFVSTPLVYATKLCTFHLSCCHHIPLDLEHHLLLCLHNHPPVHENLPT